jgi:hypothetical protein
MYISRNPLKAVEGRLAVARDHTRGRVGTKRGKDETECNSVPSDGHIDAIRPAVAMRHAGL